MKKYVYILIPLLIILSCNTSKNKKIDLEFINIYKANINNGEKIFNKSCIVCHLHGTAGATTLTNQKEWKDLIENKNKEEIFLNVFNGFLGKKGLMPQMGGCNSCSETDLFDAIEYILSINRLTIN